MESEKKEAFLQSQDGDSKDVVVKIEKMYIDVVNQVLLMALFARELTSSQTQLWAKMPLPLRSWAIPWKPSLEMATE